MPETSARENVSASWKRSRSLDHGDEFENSVRQKPIVESIRVLSTRQLIAFVLLTLMNFATIGFLAERIITFRDWEHHPLVFLGTIMLLFLVIVEHQFRWFLLPFMKTPVLPKTDRNWKVGVATTFVPEAEPIELLEQMLEALGSLDYPHETWVLDEGDDDRVKQLCHEKGVRYFSRKGDPRYQAEFGPYKSRTKYGNYNAWFAEHGFDEYEIVTSFDTDHLPSPQFLQRVLPYFDDSSIGYVQAAQAYGNQSESWVAQGAAEERYDYFSTFQMASFGMGYPIIVGGHNTHRVEALKQVGGFGPHDADDELTTLCYRDAGWRGVYVPEDLAVGLGPADLETYLTQQRRWARAVLDLKFRVYSRLSKEQSRFAMVLSYVHGFNYLLKGVLPALALLIASATCLITSDFALLSSSAAIPLSLLGATLCASALYRQQFYLDPTTERGLHWKALLLHWAAWPQMLLALGDVIWNRRVPYVVTAKCRTSQQTLAWFWPHLLSSVLLVVCWLFGVVHGTATIIHHVFVASVALATTILALTAIRGSHQLSSASVRQSKAPRSR